MISKRESRDSTWSAYTERLRSSLIALISIFLRPILKDDGRTECALGVLKVCRECFERRQRLKARISRILYAASTRNYTAGLVFVARVWSQRSTISEDGEISRAVARIGIRREPPRPPKRKHQGWGRWSTDHRHDHRGVSIVPMGKLSDDAGKVDSKDRTQGGGDEGRRVT